MTVCLSCSHTAFMHEDETSSASHCRLKSCRCRDLVLATANDLRELRAAKRRARKRLAQAHRRQDALRTRSAVG
jgi:hypothetical protein